MIDEATRLLIDELELPSMDEIEREAFSYSKDFSSFPVKLSELNGRLEANYHTTVVSVIEKYLSKKSKVCRLNDDLITKQIVLPGRFKRIYVSKGNGKVFVGGKEIGQLDPSNKKYLSISNHSKRITDELIVKENQILVTRSGTIGKVALVPRHWENWTINEHVIRIRP